MKRKAWFTLFELRGLIYYRKVLILSCIVCISWGLAVLPQNLVGMTNYTVFDYVLWPWASILYLTVGLGWIVFTLFLGEWKARSWLLLQGSLHIITASHLLPQTISHYPTQITGVVTYSTLGLLVFHQWWITPKLPN